jgi:hypothetical protein
MRKVYQFLISALIGIIGFYFLPSYLKAFSFFIPLLLVSYILRAEYQYINIFIFIAGLFIYFLLPTDLISFNFDRIGGGVGGGTGGDPSGGGGSGGDAPSNPSLMNAFAIANYTNTAINVISVVVFIIIPILVFIVSVYALVKGNVSEGLNKLFMAFSMMAFIIGFALISEFLDLQLFGIAGFVVDLYVAIIEFCLSLPMFFYNAIKIIVEIATIGRVKLPKLPNISKFTESDNLSFSMFKTTFNAMSYTQRVYLVHDSLPFLITILSIILAIVFARRKWENSIMEKINKYNMDVEFREKEERKFLGGVNVKLIVYLIIILIASLGMFLSYNSLYQTTQIQFSTIGYFSIYLIISISSLGFLIFNPKGIFKYTESNLGNTIFGIIIGEFGLFLIVQMFNTYNKTFDVLSMEIVNTSIGYVINQFLFVAPTESLLFHILIPSLVIGLLYRYTEHKVLEEGIEEANKDIRALESDISTKEELVDYYRTTGERKKLANTKSDLEDLRIRKRQIEGKKREAKLSEPSIYGRIVYIVILFAFALIIPNFLFSSFHFFSSNVDFFIFWTSGLGVLYLVSGCWFTFIGLKYGIFACILTHAIHNSLTIMLVLFYAGLI